MNLDRAILLPVAAMVLLTAIVWLRMYSERLGEIRTRRIPPQQLASAYQAAQILQNTRAADNFRNLFEMPVLFYALCLCLAVSQLTNLVLLAMAWGYVALRAYHSWIHLTHNTVIRRFQAYVASGLVLFTMWGVFAIRLIAVD